MSQEKAKWSSEGLGPVIDTEDPDYSIYLLASLPYWLGA